MMITLDNMAQKYGLLPSEVLDRASTFDLAVMDISTRWQREQRARAEGKSTIEKPKLTQEQMLAMIKNAKERKNANR